MDLEALRFFCALVEERSFHKAAERVFRSQPAVSQQLKKLEREAGRQLFDRKRAEPTPAGKLLYDRAKPLLASAEGIVRELEDFDESDAGALQVGTSDTNAMYYLPEHIRTFSDRFPHIRFNIVCRSSEEIAESVARGHLDLGIVTLPVVRAELDSMKLFEQRLTLVVPVEHALAGQQNVSLKNLTGEPVLMLHDHTKTGRLLAMHFASKEFEPTGILNSGSFEVIKRYVKQGMGIAFLPDAVVGDDEKKLRKVAVQGLPKVEIGAVWLRGAYQTNAARAFIEHLRGS